MDKIFRLLVLTFLFACSNNNPKKVEPINPNGDSELAMLMRKMENHWKKTKEAVEKGKTLPNAPDFSSLLTATLTDESMKMPGFEGFAKSYLAQVNLLAQSPIHETGAAFNGVINSCVTCHEHSCSGPIPRIQKLLIK